MNAQLAAQGLLNEESKKPVADGDAKVRDVALGGEVGIARPPDIPADWKETPARKDGHVKWVNPDNPHDYVRGKPDGTYTQVRDGKAFDANGNKVDLDAPAAHGIAAEDFVFRPRVKE